MNNKAHLRPNDFDSNGDIKVDVGTDMNEIRLTDKVYLDSQGNIRSSNGCPTDDMTQDIIDKIKVNIGLAQPVKENKNE